jgi:hypothetical protein
VRVLILNEDPDVAGYLQEWENDSFTTTIGRGDFEGREGIVLVAFGGEGLALLGRVQRAGRVATYKDRLRCDGLVSIDPSLELDELIAEVPARVSRHVGYGLLPERTGVAVLEALVELRPALADAVRRLREPTRRTPSGRGFELTAMEKDAVGLALDFTSIDRAPIGRWDGDEATPRGFLEGLDHVVLREDPIIQHDLEVFGDWEIIRGDAVVGSVRFQRGNSRLTVLNVNRLPLEEALGVDLVYYHETYNAFVLVQYKRMNREREMGWIYRPDARHATEVERMHAIPDVPPDPVDALNYRLNFGACYFKLCESVSFDPSTTSLLPGMYLPLAYMSASDAAARGPRGGAAYGYSTVPRHLNNSQFVELVQDGWVGSAGSVSDGLREFVEARVEDGRSVVFAIGERVGRRAIRR